MQCHVGPHPHADRLQGDKARAPLPVGDLPGGPRPRLAEDPEEEIQETADLADVVGDILPEWLPDSDDSTRTERPRDFSHQFPVGLLVEVMHHGGQEDQVVVVGISVPQII